MYEGLEEAKTGLENGGEDGGLLGAMIETEGFIIPPHYSVPPKVPKTFDPPTPVKQRPDWRLSANSQTEYESHILAPVYQEGKTTGKWNCPDLPRNLRSSCRMERSNR